MKTPLIVLSINQNMSYSAGATYTKIASCLGRILRLSASTEISPQ